VPEIDHAPIDFQIGRVETASGARLPAQPIFFTLFGCGANKEPSNRRRRGRAVAPDLSGLRVSTPVATDSGFRQSFRMVLHAFSPSLPL
jgi:hypothetical protein